MKNYHYCYIIVVIITSPFIQYFNLIDEGKELKTYKIDYYDENHYLSSTEWYYLDKSKSKWNAKKYEYQHGEKDSNSYLGIEFLDTIKSVSKEINIEIINTLKKINQIKIDCEFFPLRMMHIPPTGKYINHKSYKNKIKCIYYYENNTMTSKTIEIPSNGKRDCGVSIIEYRKQKKLYTKLEKLIESIDWNE